MLTIGDLLNYFSAKGLSIINEHANLSQEITGAKNVFEAQQDQITFLTEKLEDRLPKVFDSTKSRLIILSEKLAEKISSEKAAKDITWVISRNPKMDLIDCLQQFFVKHDHQGFMHPTAVIGPNVNVGVNTYIGPHVVIEDDVTIGERCLIDANVVIKSGCRIGNDVIIKPMSVIGGSGFGYAKSDDGSYQMIPHVGRVIIEDNVHIGSNTCIDRGSLSDTIIHRGVRIDNLVHIAHNVRIGENSLVIACSMIAGSVEIESNCWVAPSVSVRNDIRIGKNSVVGLGSVVTKDIQEGVTVVGVPATDLKSFRAINEYLKDVLKLREEHKE